MKSCVSPLLLLLLLCLSPALSLPVIRQAIPSGSTVPIPNVDVTPSPLPSITVLPTLTATPSSPSSSFVPTASAPTTSPFSPTPSTPAVAPTASPTFGTSSAPSVSASPTDSDLDDNEAEPSPVAPVDSSGLSTGAIVGIVIGSLVGLLLLLLCCFCLVLPLVKRDRSENNNNNNNNATARNTTNQQPAVYSSSEAAATPPPPPPPAVVPPPPPPLKDEARQFPPQPTPVVPAPPATAPVPPRGPTPPPHDYVLGVGPAETRKDFDDLQAKYERDEIGDDSAVLGVDRSSMSHPEGPATFERQEEIPGGDGSGAISDATMALNAATITEEGGDVPSLERDPVELSRERADF